MVLLISYDLNGHERPAAYTAVKKAIEEGSVDFRRPLYSQWFVETEATPNDWQQHLSKVMDANDKLFICQVAPGSDGWLDKEVWTWLNARVQP
jgi:hypothetical protein